MSKKNTEEFLQTHKYTVFAFFSFLYFVGVFAKSIVKPFWFDELLVWQVAQLPSLSEIWKAIGPMDPTPPFFLGLVKISQSFFGTGELATRFPAILGVWVALLFLFLILDKRCGTVIAFIGIIALSLTKALSYTYEARSYAWVLAFCAISFRCWQLASEHPRKLPLAGLFFSLTAAMYTHFYAVLLVIPLLAGEAWKLLKDGKVNWSIITTFTLVGIASTPLVPLVLKCTDTGILLSSFWAQPSTIGFFTSLFKLFWPLGVLLGCAIILHFISRIIRQKSHSPIGHAEVKCFFPAHERAAAICLALLPLFGLLIAILFTNAYTDRYVLSSTIGATILLAYTIGLLAKPGTPERIIILLAFFFLLCFRHGMFLQTYLHTDGKTENPIPVEFYSEENLPIVILSPLEFMQIQHYAPDSLKNRLFYLIDFSKNYNYGAGYSSSAELSVSGIRKYQDLNVEDFDIFIQKNKTFFVWGKKSPLIPQLIKIARTSNSEEPLNKQFFEKSLVKIMIE